MILILSKVIEDDFVFIISSGCLIVYIFGLYYYGILNGDVIVIVVISVFDNEIYGLISIEYGNYVIGKVDGNVENVYLIYNDCYYLDL